MIHIIGANGYIGTKLVYYFRQRNVAFDCFSNIVDENCSLLDLGNLDTTNLSFKEGDIAILLSAISSPDICENNYELAYSINVTGTAKFIDYCFSRRTKVIFLSSDTVNGATGNKVNNEYSEVNPFGNYAKMKYEIEKRYKDNPLFKTLRLSYVLSEEDKFTKYLASCIEKGAYAEVFNGMFRNVILLDTVLESIYRLTMNFDFNNFYLINVSGNQCLSRIDIAEWYKKNIDKRLVYKTIPVPESILNGRPNIIKTESLFLVKLLGHKLTNII